LFETAGVCFVSPEPAQSPIFSFAQFIAGFSFLALVYSISDLRYRFRIGTARIPLGTLAYFIYGTLAVAELFTAAWFALRKPVPWFLSKESLLQVGFAAVFVALAMQWVWYAFFRPSNCSRWNAKRLARWVYFAILRGLDSELPVIANELARCAPSIVRLAHKRQRRAEVSPQRRLSAADYANDILLMIGSRKFCRHVVSSSPATAIAFLQSIAKMEAYELPLGQFAMNVSVEALLNKDSILYHEDHGFYSGLFGYTKPFTKSLYGNFAVVEALASSSQSPLDVGMLAPWKWDAKQCEAYARATLITLESYLADGRWRHHSYALTRAFEVIKQFSHDLYTLDGSEDVMGDTSYRARAAVEFVKDAIELFEKHMPLDFTLRRRRAEQHWDWNLFDQLASLMFEILINASRVRGPFWTCWSTQHNTVWSEFFSFRKGKAWSVVRFKLRRLIYDEIVNLQTFPNFKSSKLLGLCLNVCHFSPVRTQALDTASYPIQRAVLNWTRANFGKLRDANSDVADDCLVSRMSFDAVGSRIVKTYEKNLHKEAPQEFLPIEPQPLRA
jgi:hypothetical protein